MQLLQRIVTPKRVLYSFRPKLYSTQTKAISKLLDLDLASESNEQPVRVVGWIRSFRDQKAIKFLHVNDGTDPRHLQLVVLRENLTNKQDYDRLEATALSFNTSIEASGRLQPSSNKQQKVELHVSELRVVNPCNPGEYPFQAKKEYSLEQLRQHLHLRSHTTLFSSIMKFRSELTMSLHEFFHKQEFTQVHTPLLTTNNCEGGCETFQVNTSDKSAKKQGMIFVF